MFRYILDGIHLLQFNLSKQLHVKGTREGVREGFGDRNAKSRMHLKSELCGGAFIDFIQQFRSLSLSGRQMMKKLNIFFFTGHCKHFIASLLFFGGN